MKIPIPYHIEKWFTSKKGRYSLDNRWWDNEVWETLLGVVGLVALIVTISLVIADSLNYTSWIKITDLNGRVYEWKCDEANNLTSGKHNNGTYLDLEDGQDSIDVIFDGRKVTINKPKIEKTTANRRFGKERKERGCAI